MYGVFNALRAKNGRETLVKHIECLLLVADGDDDGDRLQSLLCSAKREKP
jgi:hypothetical protein